MGLSRVASVIAAAPVVRTAACHPVSAARAITIPLAMTHDALPWCGAEPIP